MRRLNTALVGTVLLGAVAVGQSAAVLAKTPAVNFKLMYHAAQLANQAYDGKSEIIGR